MMKINERSSLSEYLSCSSDGCGILNLGAAIRGAFLSRSHEPEGIIERQASGIIDSAFDDVPVPASSSACEAYESFLEEVAEMEAAEERARAQRARFQDAGGWHAVETGGRLGLVNLRNTCWMNSVMQVLAHLGPFTAHLLELSEDTIPTENCDAGSSGSKTAVEAEPEDPKRVRSVSQSLESDSHELKIVRCVQDLFHALWQEHLREGPVNPGRLHVALMKLAPWFLRRGHQQKDALEFLDFLLNRMHEELHRPKRMPPSTDEYPPDFHDLQAWLPFLRKARSPIMSLFRGSLHSVVTCKECGHSSRRPEDALHLSLPMQQLACNTDVDVASNDSPSNCRQRLRNWECAPIKLQEAFSALVAEELLAGDNCWECDRCARKVEATKRVELAELPPVLMMHLLRFAYDPMVNSIVKIRGRVELPHDRLDGLDLSVCCSKQHQGSAWYDIVGVVNHHGSDTSSGHYTANCKHDIDGCWYSFDDKTVTPIEHSAAWLPECAYVMCLVRRKDPP